MTIKCSARFGGILAALLLCALWTPTLANAVDGVSVDGSEGMLLADPQLRQAKAKAIAGDGLATRKVLNHYILGVGDLDAADAWSRVAAIQGDQDEMINHARHLLHVGTDEACMEARAWIDSVRKSPSTQTRKERAERLLRRISSGKPSEVPCAKWQQSITRNAAESAKVR